MAYSAATYKGDGSQSTFIIPFDYLQKDFVKVTINEVDKVYAQDYNVDGRELSFPTAPPSGSIIKVYRETPTDRMVKWNEGSVLTSSNMTTQQIQELHLIEETTYNLENSSMIKTEDNHKWEGQYLPITHVGDPTDDSDVVNLGTIKKEETGFLASVRSQLDKWLADLGTTYNNYSKSLKESFDSYASSLKNQFDAHTTSLLSDFNNYKDTLKNNYDTYTNNLSTTFNNYKDTLLNKYNEYLASLTATKDAVKDSEANASKYKDEAKNFSDSAKTSEVNAKASEVAAAESARQAAGNQINADWNETNVDSKAYIKNKPDVPTKADIANSVTTKALTVSGETSVPTANEGNSSNTIASTEFVAKSLAKMVDSAPESLNTLNELAKALGDDPNFATTILNELAKKLNSAEAESTYATKQEAALLDASGNAYFPGTVTAPKFTGTFLTLPPGNESNANAGNSALVIKAASSGAAPNSGCILEFGNTPSWRGQLFIGDNATQGLYWNGWSDGQRGKWKKIYMEGDTVNNSTGWNGYTNNMGTEDNTDTWIPVISGKSVKHTTKNNITAACVKNSQFYEKHGNLWINFNGRGWQLTHEE